MAIHAIGSALPVLTATVTPSGKAEETAQAFNTLLLEMILRESGITSMYSDESGSGGNVIGDLMTQAFASQLAGQIPILTATQLMTSSSAQGVQQQ